MSKPSSYQTAVGILDRAAATALQKPIVRVRTHRGPKLTIYRYASAEDGAPEQEIEVAIEGDVFPAERETRDNPGRPITAEVTSAWQIDTGAEVTLTDDETYKAERILIDDYIGE